MDFEKSLSFIQLLVGFLSREMRNKTRFSLEGLFYAWYSANLFIRRTLGNVESLHDYTIAPYEGETPYHDVKDKMNGSIRMLCFWINVNLFYRLWNHFQLYLENVLNYIKHHGVKEPSSAQAPSPNAPLAVENKGQNYPQEDLLVFLTPEQNKERSELHSFKRVTKEEISSLEAEYNQSEVAPSGCIAW